MKEMHKAKYNSRNGCRIISILSPSVSTLSTLMCSPAWKLFKPIVQGFFKEVSLCRPMIKLLAIGDSFLLQPLSTPERLEVGLKVPILKYDDQPPSWSYLGVPATSHPISIQKDAIVISEIPSTSKTLVSGTGPNIIKKDIPITQEITKVLGTMCQKPGRKTKYLFPII